MIGNLLEKKKKERYARVSLNSREKKRLKQNFLIYNKFDAYIYLSNRGKKESYKIEGTREPVQEISRVVSGQCQVKGLFPSLLLFFPMFLPKQPTIKILFSSPSPSSYVYTCHCLSYCISLLLCYVL